MDQELKLRFPKNIGFDSMIQAAILGAQAHLFAGESILLIGYRIARRTGLAPCFVTNFGRTIKVYHIHDRVDYLVHTDYMGTLTDLQKSTLVSLKQSTCSLVKYISNNPRTDWFAPILIMLRYFRKAEAAKKTAESLNEDAVKKITELKTMNEGAAKKITELEAELLTIRGTLDMAVRRKFELENRLQLAHSYIDELGLNFQHTRAELWGVRDMLRKYIGLAESKNSIKPKESLTSEKSESKAEFKEKHSAKVLSDVPNVKLDLDILREHSLGLGVRQFVISKDIATLQNLQRAIKAKESELAIREVFIVEKEASIRANNQDFLTSEDFIRERERTLHEREIAVERKEKELNALLAALENRKRAWDQKHNAADRVREDLREMAQCVKTAASVSSSHMRAAQFIATDIDQEFDQNKPLN